MPRNVSTAVPAHRLVLSVATLYWLRDENLDGSGLPFSRMKSSNVCPPSTTRVNATHQGLGITVALTVTKKQRRPFAHHRVLGELEISLDPFLDALGANDPTGTCVIELQPPDNALSDAPAGPDTGDTDENRPGNCGHDDETHDGLFRPVRLQLDLATSTDGLLRVDNLQDPNAGQLQLRGPYWTAVMHPDPASTGAQQRIMLDWKPDWLRRVKPVRRPKLSSRRGNATRMIVLHNISGGTGPGRRFPNGAAAITTFMLNKVTKKEDGEVVLDSQGEPVKIDQDSGIHYVVDVDGHVTKMAHESFHTKHGGGSSPREWGRLGGSGINNSAVGIEHALLKNDPVFYPALIDASVDLVRQIVARYPEFRPWNLVGHSDMVNKKLCPGVNFPWLIYENELLGRAGDPPRDVPMALCADADYYPNLRVIYNGFFAANRDAALGDAKDGVADDRTAVRELQRDLRRIGYRFHRENGTFDDATVRAVREFHSRFMNGSHAMPQNPTQGSVKVVNRDSAIQIKRVLHMLDFLESIEYPVQW